MSDESNQPGDRSRAEHPQASGSSTSTAGWSSVPGSHPAPWTSYTGSRQAFEPPASQQPQPRRGQRLGAGRLVASGAVLVVLALAAGFGGAAGYLAWVDDDATARTPGNEPISSLDQQPNADEGSDAEATGVEAVAETVHPSVVSIAVSSPQGQGGGSGVVISTDGQILTNNHVAAAGSEGGQLQVQFSDGTSAPAEVLGTDPLTDLVVIEAGGASDLTAASLASSEEVAVGEEVVAICSPVGLDGTFASGIISAVQRPVSRGEQGGQQDGQPTVIDAMQTDAPINPGNSGGPLVNMDGEVIGINSAIVTGGPQSQGSIGLGFAIPIDQARPIAEQLIENGEASHARIGIGVTDATGDTPGAQVASVEGGGSAAEAGLQEGDIVTKIDDRHVPNATTLIAATRSYRPGDTVTLTYVRDGEEQTTEVELGSDAEVA